MSTADPRDLTCDELEDAFRQLVDELATERARNDDAATAIAELSARLTAIRQYDLDHGNPPAPRVTPDGAGWFVVSETASDVDGDAMILPPHEARVLVARLLCALEAT